MRNKLIALTFFALATTQAFTCSISFDEEKIKNLLIANTANQFYISLTKATKLKADDFSFRLYGEVPGSSCENYLEYKSQVSISYRPSITQKCELSVEAVLTENLQAEAYPFQEYTFNFPSSSCTYVPIRVIPRPRLPLPRRP